VFSFWSFDYVFWLKFFFFFVWREKKFFSNNVLTSFSFFFLTPPFLGLSKPFQFTFWYVVTSVISVPFGFHGLTIWVVFWNSL